MVTELFLQYDSTDKALKQLLLGAVDDMFVNALSDPHVGYANVTTLQLLTHLYNTYGKVTDADLHRNLQVMMEPIDIELPIETFYRKIEECVDFAASGGTPFSTQQVVSTAFHTILQSNAMPDDVREWRRKPTAEKTWANFKKHFTRAHNDLRETKATTSAAGYHSANAVQENTVTALNNLANATIADRQTMTNLTATISVLTQELAATNMKMAEAITRATKLEKEVAFLKKKPKTSAPPSTHYCWTHGIRCAHTSKECTKRAAGHKEEATEENKMGGRETKWPYRRK